MFTLDISSCSIYVSIANNNKNVKLGYLSGLIKIITKYKKKWWYAPGFTGH